MTPEPHLPGRAIPDPAAEAAMKAVAAEPRAATNPPGAPRFTPTHTPQANAAARSNIVPDGPGTFAGTLPLPD